MARQLATAMLSCLTVGTLALSLPTPIYASATSTKSEEILISQLPGRVCVGVQTNPYAPPPTLYTFVAGIVLPSMIFSPTSAVLLDGPKDVGLLEGLAYLVQLDSSGLRGWVPVSAVRQGEC